MNKVIKYVIYDIIRNRFVLSYTLLLLFTSLAFYGFGSSGHKGVLSLLNIILMVVPLVSIVFTTIQFYNSYEFLEVLSAQPVSRKTIFMSQFWGITISLCLAFFVGVGIPTWIYDGTGAGGTLIICGLLLSLVFVSLALFACTLTRDRAKGIGISLGIWFYFCLLYDGMALTLLMLFSDYPLDQASLVLTALNPVDLARILILMKLDISALLGITGAIFQKFFTSEKGIIVSVLLLFAWIIFPLLKACRTFLKKDL